MVFSRLISIYHLGPIHTWSSYRIMFTLEPVASVTLVKFEGRQNGGHVIESGKN
jgi:hypothetical protein